MAWTKVTKASGTNWTSILAAELGASSVISTAGGPIGLLLALTYATTSSITSGFQWTRLVKPASTSWTNIAKAT